jgi:hypothetical protein
MGKSRHDLGGATPGLIETWHLLDRTPLRHLQPSAGVAVVEGEHLSVAHDLLAADEDIADRSLAGRIN